MSNTLAIPTKNLIIKKEITELEITALEIVNLTPQNKGYQKNTQVD